MIHDVFELQLFLWFFNCSLWRYGDDSDNIFGDYSKIIFNFLEDPNRSGELYLNRDRFSVAALCCLENLCHPPVGFAFALLSHDHRIRRNTPWMWRKISVRDANRLMKRETRQLHRIVPKLSYSTPSVEFPHHVMASWSIFYQNGLEHLPFLLERSGYSEALIRFLRRRRMFAVGTLEYPCALNRAKAAIANYLSMFLCSYVKGYLSQVWYDLLGTYRLIW